MNELIAQMGKEQHTVDPDILYPLIHKVQAGVAAKAWMEENPIDDAVSKQYKKLLATGKAAEDRLIRMNSRLILKQVAKKMKHAAAVGRHADAESLFQFGAIGLMTAIRKFETNRGLRLSTYASHWIRQQIDRGWVDNPEQGRIRLPVHADFIARIVGGLQMERRDVGKTPYTYAELEAILKEDDRINAKPTAKAIERIMEVHMSSFACIDSPPTGMVGEDSDERNLGEIIAGNYGDFMSLDRLEAAKAIGGLLDNLPERESFVLKHRFIEEMTLEETGNLLGVTRERVRQIEAKALNKLKAFLKGDKYALMGAVQKRNALKMEKVAAVNDKTKIRAAVLGKLTPMQQQIYVAIAEEGLMTGQVCRKLGITSNNLQYQKRLMSKLGIKPKKPKKPRKVAKPKKAKMVKPKPAKKAEPKAQAGNAMTINGVSAKRSRVRICVNGVWVSYTTGNRYAKYIELMVAGESNDAIMANLGIDQRQMYAMKYYVKSKLNFPVDYRTDNITLLVSDGEAPKPKPKPTKGKRKLDRLGGVVEIVSVEQAALGMYKVNGVFMSERRFKVMEIMRKTRRSAPSISKELKCSMAEVTEHEHELRRLGFIR